MPRPTRVPESFPLLQDPPFSLDGTRTLLLVLPADPAALAALTARTFGWAAPEIVIEPAARSVICAITDVAAARASDPRLGSFAYQEATFFVPVKGTRGGVPFFGLHVPFIYPTEGLAIAAGREIYGLPKKPARIVFPSESELEAGARVEVRALCAARFDGAPWQERQLVRITTAPQGLAAALADEVLDAIDGLAGSLPLPGRLLRQDLVQLKQPADVTPGGVPPRVLAKQVVRVEAPIRALSAVRLLAPKQVSVEVADWASEPIRSTLGLAATLTPSFAASLTMDFRFEAGEVWLERPAPAAAPAKKKVIVLGGGVAAMAAAHALTDTEARREAYDVRLLSEGHHLGGKGGNVRDPAKNERIEEHGLHVIFGFYHNFLRLFRGVFAEANRPVGVFPRTFAEAFVPEPEIVFADGADAWRVRFPETPDTWGAGPNEPSELVKAFQVLLEALTGTSFSMLMGLVKGGSKNPVQRQVLKFALVLLRGLTEDVIVKGKSWEELDAIDFRAWMMGHAPVFGFDDLEWSAIMQVPYDGIFAYEGPDQSKPVLGAGMAAKMLMKLVTDYEKAPYHVMTAGMGEAVVMPLYEVLKARGVRTEMFCRVTEIRMIGSRVDEIVIQRQARVLAGDDAYDPVVHVKGTPCWRRDPDPAQLDPASPALTEDPFSDASTASIGAPITLKHGVDFDWVICGLPAPVTAHVLRGHAGIPLLENIAKLPTVATLHAQLWTSETLHALGWTKPWGGGASKVVGGFRQPLNSMLDSEHVLGREDWGPGGPRGLLYASGPFGAGWATDSEVKAARAAAQTAADAEARTWVQDELGKLLPAAEVGGRFDLGRLHAPRSPGAPMADQYVRCNVDRSSRYLLMKPGTLRLRPRPSDASLANLRFVGDWTRNGIDIPCMEGTVTSALEAIASITGEDLDLLF
jgi:uncharacterized protein with NAD-binding domain and iron-sulfur cluster